MVARARGANVFFRLKHETIPGVIPGGNWRVMRAYTFGLSKSQNLLDEPVLGEGREPTDPVKGAINIGPGDIVVPVDHRLFYDWLVLLMGAPQAGPTQIGARGFIEFRANPTATDTITLDGVTWTFVASGATGNETDIQGSLQATLDELVTDLNASVDADIAAATYSRIGDRLVIQHDTADASGNAYTLAQALTVAAKLSGATLVGGGFYSRTFHSALANLPSASIERHHSDLSTGNPYRIVTYVTTDRMSITRSREGSMRATFNCRGQDQVEQASSAAGTPASLDLTVFSQFQGSLLVDDVQVANVTAGELTLSNNLDVVEALRDDGLIEGADPGAWAVGLNLTARFSDNALKQAAEADTPVAVRFGALDRTSGAEILFHLHRLHLPTPAEEISGPGGLEVTYGTIGAKEATVTRSVTATLINDVADYTIA